MRDRGERVEIPEPPEQTHSKKIITGTTGANPFKKMREMREQMESRAEKAYGEAETEEREEIRKK